MRRYYTRGGGGKEELRVVIITPAHAGHTDTLVLKLDDTWEAIHNARLVLVGDSAMRNLLLNRQQPHLIDHRQSQRAFCEGDLTERGYGVVAEALVAGPRVGETDTPDSYRAASEQVDRVHNLPLLY